ncbi:MAG: DUF6504 family protein [Actinobacteria bacterium]|nr:DUF6504 family protein [Actinomycetota bacterium]
MSRRYRSEPVEVVMDERGEPAVFRWRGRRYAVQVIVTSWVEAAPRTGITGVYDLYRIVRGQRWRWGLARVID